MPRSFGNSGDGWGEESGSPVVKFILQRSWVLIVPFIAIGWYQAREVAPRIKALDAQIAAEQDSVDNQRAVILTGAILWLDAVVALPLIFSFVWLIQTRFIRDEEARLTLAFGPEFDLWAARTRRWFGRKSGV